MGSQACSGRGGLPGEQHFAALVERRALDMQLDAVAAACYEADAESSCSYARGAGAPFDVDSRVNAACVAKLATAMLVLEAVDRDVLRLTTTLADLFGPGLSDGITVLQLLDHTHGLDGADMELAPVAPDGCIDIGALAALRAREPLHAPGRLYSYGHAGYVLLGAALERLYGMPFGQILRRRLLEPMGIVSALKPSAEGMHVCPATGASFEISARDALALLRTYWQFMERPVGVDARTWSDYLLGAVQDLPGYNWRETGYTCGWRCEPDGWLTWMGSHPSGTTLVLRCQPRSGRGLAVVGKVLRVKALAEHLAADLWDHPAGQLRRVNPASAVDIALHIALCQGTYEDGASSITVESSENKHRMLIESKPQAHRSESARSIKQLRAAGSDLFFTMPPDRGDFYFVQFLRATPAEVPSHIWNGRRVWRRK
jgi:hypothetical protein